MRSARPLLLAAGLAAALAFALPLRPAGAQDEACAYAAAVCDARQAVFVISDFSPIASAVRLGPDLLVTARHAVAEGDEVEVLLPGRAILKGRVVPSPLPLDLVLLRVPGLPEGPVLKPAALAEDGEEEPALHVVGADIGAARVEAYPPGAAIARPLEDKPLSRLHHGAHTQPGNSGGALVDGEGRLVGIAVAGGSGRFEAIPASAIAALRAASGPEAEAAEAGFQAAVRDCSLGLEALGDGQAPEGAAADVLAARCLATGNRQFYDLAGQVFGRAGDLERATALFEASLEQDPQALNARLSLAITLHMAQRWERELPHLHWLIERLPRDPQVLRLAVQAGKWTGDAALAEQGYRGIQAHFPAQAEAARGFLDSDASPPPR
ncbi:MAG: trypsin-like peptidase domain-containing protein [Tistlia sp.]|uniref:trypsin-like peptidase domain-containing protein n=1 Tax=Tistlia sp. TaxID=3057121 RepID=UPI0034A25955